MRIGISPEKEQHLLYLARDGLMQALPPDWKVWYVSELKKPAREYINKIKTFNLAFISQMEFTILIQKQRTVNGITRSMLVTKN